MRPPKTTTTTTTTTTTRKRVLNMASSDSQIDKPQRGRPKRAELPDVNRNTGAQSINTERFFMIHALVPQQRRRMIDVP